MTTDDLEAASPGDLFNVLRDLDRGVKGLRQDVQDEVAARTRSLRWVVAVGGLVVALALVFAGLGIVQNGRLQDQADRLQAEITAREEERVAASVVACENGNATRQAIEDRFDSFIDVLAGLGTPPATAEEAQAERAVIDKLRRDFAAALPAALGASDCTPPIEVDPATTTTGG